MRKLIFLFAMVAALGAMQSRASDLMQGHASIELRSEVVARSGQVVLGDVAIIRTRDLDTIRRLAELPLGEAPRTGAQSVVRREVIARWVRSQLGIPRHQVEWSGAEEILIRSVAQELAASPIEKVAAAAPLVSRGQWVSVFVKSGLVELQGRAEALQDGAKGQVVQVRSSKGSEPVAARVVAPGRVEASL